jgi:hypothetical protein
MVLLQSGPVFAYLSLEVIDGIRSRVSCTIDIKLDRGFGRGFWQKRERATSVTVYVIHPRQRAQGLATLVAWE